MSRERGSYPVPLTNAGTIAKSSRDDAVIDLWRQWPVDSDFFVAGRFTLVERRIVEQGKPDGTLDPHRTLAAEEERSCVSIRVTPGWPVSVRKIRSWAAISSFMETGIQKHHHGVSTAAPRIWPARSMFRTSLA
ncbi:hypothetical protein JJB98_22900 [Bradyrhizobium diazoefficiens]|nr:hypothetical protein JJB98_22900 [Bradyrhizobium diazoefficiens]